MNQFSQHPKKTELPIDLPRGFFTPVCQELYHALNQQGATTRFVGGCVRDVVLGQAVTDFDLATTHTPDAATKILEQAGFNIEPIGINHGTILAIKNKETFEVTTLRRDLQTDGRHATVAFTTNFKEDAARRDFTFNALYMDNAGHITDYFQGLDDLNAGLVRFVGIPEQRLQEDWLRALRYLRFYGRFGKTPPSKETYMALKNAAPSLKTLSAERITSEVLKTALTAHPEQAFTLMQELGYFKALELEAFSLEQFKAYLNHYPNTPDPLVALCAGFWGKLEENALLTTPHLRFSKKQKSFLKAMGAKNLAKITIENIPYSCWLLGAKNTAQLWRYGAVFHKESAFKEAAAQAEKTSTPPFPLKGTDIAPLGFKKGPEMGRALEKTAVWWAQNNFPDKKACLAWLKNNSKAL